MIPSGGRLNSNSIGKRAPSREDYEPYPAIIASQVPGSLSRGEWQRDLVRLTGGDPVSFHPVNERATARLLEWLPAASKCAR